MTQIWIRIAPSIIVRIQINRSAPGRSNVEFCLHKLYPELWIPAFVLIVGVCVSGERGSYDGHHHTPDYAQSSKRDYSPQQTIYRALSRAVFLKGRCDLYRKICLPFSE